VRQAAELLLEAERPLLLLGKGVRWSEPYAALQSLVEQLGMPFVPSPMGRGSLPDDHPLCFASARSTAMRGADVVLVLGARLNWMFGMGRALAPDAKIIQVDIAPEEIGLQRPVAVGITADAGRVLDAHHREMDGKTDGLSHRAPEGPWLSALRESREKNEKLIEPLLMNDSAPMNHHRMLRSIRDVLPRDAVVTVDGQIVLSAGRQVIQSYVPAARLNSGSNGCMGVGVPFAVGAKLALPDRTVVSVNGDCAFGFNGWEVETSLRMNAPVVFVIDNNEGIMGGVLEGQMFREGHPERVAMYQPGIRYDKIGEAFGAHGENVEKPEELEPALKRAIASGRTAVVNVRVDPAAIWPIPRAGRANALMGY
jgi:thiamine pyrophosphate-dependent acetolactate synthase large subunit-like protein